MTYLGYLLYMCFSTLNLLLPLEGFVNIYRTKKQHLLRGGFIFFNAINLSSWLIFGFLTKNLVFSNPIFLGVGAFYVVLSLIMFQEYANIVYHSVIILNYSWWIRQQKPDLIYNISLLTAAMFLTVPHLGSLYYMTRKKDRRYISFLQLGGHFASAVLYLLFSLLEGFYILAALNIVKMGILAAQVFVYRKLEKKEKMAENLKKKE